MGLVFKGKTEKEFRSSGFKYVKGALGIKGKTEVKEFDKLIKTAKR
jgi:hypothetical protein